MQLISEQIPNDGKYRIKRLVGEANERLDQIGKRGKRAKIVAKPTSLSLQFTFKDGNGNSQKNPGLGAIPLSPNGILEAEKIAQLVTGQLVAGTFTWDWFNSLIGKPTSEQTKQLTCKEMVELFKKHFFKQRKDDKCPQQSWYLRARGLEQVLGNLNKPLSITLIREIIELSANNSRNREYTIQGLIEFLKYFDNTDYKKVIYEYKKHNKVKAKKRNVPDDIKITKVQKIGFKISKFGNKRFQHKMAQWQFLYGLLATYGLRVHEAWNIANWDYPVTLKDGDWVAVDTDDETEESKQYSGEDLIVPAILDPNNKDYILCIKHATKTGYRMAMPLSPKGHNWIEEFNLLQPLNLPDIKNPLERTGSGQGSYKCTNAVCGWFYRRKYGFTPHDLRHAYNHRGHRQGVNIDVLCQSLGHSFTVNTTIYRNSKSDQVLLGDMLNAVNKKGKTISKLEELEAENKALKAELKAAKDKIELLETKLQLNRTIAESKSNN